MNTLVRICCEVTPNVFNSWVRRAGESYNRTSGNTAQSREEYIKNYIIQEYEFYLENRFAGRLARGELR